MRKVDPEMRKRLVEELWKLDGTYAEIAERIGCNKTTIGLWINSDCMPSAYHFANFHRAGMDVIYILTGERHV